MSVTLAIKHHQDEDAAGAREASQNLCFFGLDTGIAAALAVLSFQAHFGVPPEYFSSSFSLEQHQMFRLFDAEMTTFSDTFDLNNVDKLIWPPSPTQLKRNEVHRSCCGTARRPEWGALRVTFRNVHSIWLDLENCGQLYTTIPYTTRYYNTWQYLTLTPGPWWQVPGLGRSLQLSLDLFSKEPEKDVEGFLQNSQKQLNGAFTAHAFTVILTQVSLFEHIRKAQLAPDGIWWVLIVELDPIVTGVLAPRAVYCNDL